MQKQYTFEELLSTLAEIDKKNGTEYAREFRSAVSREAEYKHGSSTVGVSGAATRFTGWINNMLAAYYKPNAPTLYPHEVFSQRLAYLEAWAISVIIRHWENYLDSTASSASTRG